VLVYSGISFGPIAIAKAKRQAETRHLLAIFSLFAAGMLGVLFAIMGVQRFPRAGDVYAGNRQGAVAQQPQTPCRLPAFSTITIVKSGWPRSLVRFEAPAPLSWEAPDSEVCPSALVYVDTATLAQQPRIVVIAHPKSSADR
jgi:hypothetical protein